MAFSCVGVESERITGGRGAMKAEARTIRSELRATLCGVEFAAPR